jgi:threonine dehydrogenase-like Zn-dependent dehydrogenase
VKALVFGVEPGFEPPPMEAEPEADALVAGLETAPLVLTDAPEPRLVDDDWVVLRSRVTGICGSDRSVVLMDMGCDMSDFSLTAFLSFPQVMGHEVVADVVETGPAVDTVVPGDRIVLQCWLSCRPRGIDPVCPACAAGDYALCWNFTEGRIAPGIHVGNSRDATGGFAELLPAHQSQLIRVPEAISDEVAVLADPFAVSLHTVVRHPPPPGGKAVVWGCGALGVTAVAVLRALHPDVEVAAVALHPAQQQLAAKLGATVFDAHLDAEALVVGLAEWSGGRLHQPWFGLPVAHPGAVDVVYDTIGSPQTIEAALRITRARGTIAVSGVHAAGRFEWSPLYFKEVNLVGSNAFGVEAVRGVRKHAIEHYLDFVESGEIDVASMLTHTFRLEEWKAAFASLVHQDTTGAIKVAFDFR